VSASYGVLCLCQCFIAFKSLLRVLSFHVWYIYLMYKKHSWLFHTKQWCSITQYYIASIEEQPKIWSKALRYFETDSIMHTTRCRSLCLSHKLFIRSLKKMVKKHYIPLLIKFLKWLWVYDSEERRINLHSLSTFRNPLRQLLVILLSFIHCLLASLTLHL